MGEMAWSYIDLCCAFGPNTCTKWWSKTEFGKEPTQEKSMQVNTFKDSTAPYRRRMLCQFAY